MFIIFYKDGRQEHTYNEMDITTLDWSDVIMVINTHNVDD